MLKNQEEIIKNWNHNQDPTVSISCITYNHENSIERSIKSFLSQETEFKFEILITDDASNDKTKQIIKKYEELYPKIIFPIYRKKNTFRQGYQPHESNFTRAKGDFVALCDGDDYWNKSYKLQYYTKFN